MATIGELAGGEIPVEMQISPPGGCDEREFVDGDASAVFGWREDCRPQERAHAYLERRGVDRLGGDTALLAVVRDLCRRSYALGREEASGRVSEAMGHALDIVALLRRAGG